MQRRGLRASRRACSFVRASLVAAFATDDRLVFFQDAIFHVLAELPGHGNEQAAETIAFGERVHGIAHEHAVFAIHHTETADQDLVIQDDVCEPLDVPHGRPFLERVDLHVGDCQAVKGRGVVAHFGYGFHSVPLFDDC